MGAVKCSIDDLLSVAKKIHKDNAPEFCGVDFCGRSHYSLNLCQAHYLRLHRYRQNNPVVYKYPFDDVNEYVANVAYASRGSNGFYCSVPDCDGRRVARSLCKPHYLVWWRLNRG